MIVNEADGPAEDLSARVREQAFLMRDQVDYYLARARVAALAGRTGALTEVDPILQALARTFGKIHLNRDIEIAVPPEGRLRFRGERQDLEEMAGNLIDNACKWAATRVLVTASAIDDRERRFIRLIVEDDGPGLSPSARLEAVKRGRRLDESKPGSGLGLSIVADLASHYRGRLTLVGSSLGGARAELDLPGDLSGS